MNHCLKNAFQLTLSLACISLASSGCFLSKSSPAAPPAAASPATSPTPTPTPTPSGPPTGEVATVKLTTTGSHTSNSCFAITATGVNASGTVVSADRDVTFDLLSSSSGGFYPDSTCGTYQYTATLPKGQSALTLYYKDVEPKAMLLTASYNSVWGDQLSITLTPPPIHSIRAFVSTPAGTATGGGPCDPIIIAIFDSTPFVMIQSMTQNTTITFSGLSGSGLFYSDAVCTVPVTSTTILAGQTSVSSGLYFGGNGGTGTTSFNESWSCRSNSGTGFSSSITE